MIFTRRGPIEIHFKLSHYVSLALTIVVGVSSIVYYSIVGISSAIDVAQKDIITEASANLPTNIKENKSNELESNSVLNEINIDESKSNDNKIGLESNISLPEQTNEFNFNTKAVTTLADSITNNSGYQKMTSAGWSLSTGIQVMTGYLVDDDNNIYIPNLDPLNAMLYKLETDSGVTTITNVSAYWDGGGLLSFGGYANCLLKDKNTYFMESANRYEYFPTNKIGRAHV